MDGEKKSIIVEDMYHQMRIDKFLSSIEDNLTRTYIQKLIEQNFVTVNHNAVKASFKVLAGDEVSYWVPLPIDLKIEPENIHLDIVYEDNDIIIINKVKGMVVHPAAGHYSGTLVNALLYHCKDSLSGINGIMRPGIVHRIDMNTTGILVACKNDKSHQFIAGQLKEHSITRKYNALVYGYFSNKYGKIEEPIGRHPYDRKKMTVNYKNGKHAVTNYHIIEPFGKKYSHIECMLETGRTHQIRVHMSHINHPLIGDTIYGHTRDEFNITGQALHAGLLGLIHPRTKKYIEFEAPLPEYFIKLIDKLRKV